MSKINNFEYMIEDYILYDTTKKYFSKNNYIIWSKYEIICLIS